MAVTRTSSEHDTVHPRARAAASHIDHSQIAQVVLCTRDHLACERERARDRTSPREAAVLGAAAPEVFLAPP